MGLAFPHKLTPEEARNLLEKGTFSQYERAAEKIGMPYLKERAVVVALTYNRGVSSVNNKMQPFVDAVRDGDRAEAWYQLRYQSWGSNSAAQKGLRKARFMEAQAFGLYDDASKVMQTEAENIYKMFQKHRDDIQSIETRWGVSLEGASADKSHNVIAMGNKDYAQLTLVHGSIPTIVEALEPAKVQYLSQLREQFPEQSAQLTDRTFFTGAIKLEPSTSNNPDDPSRLTIDESKLALRKGDRGPEVRALQEQLTTLGYTGAKKRPITLDGNFGPDTVYALSAFQKDHSIPGTVPGVADVPSQQALRESTQSPSQKEAQAPKQEQRYARPEDPRHPDNSGHALYNQLHERIPGAPEHRLLQFTAACHTQGITAKSLGEIHLGEAKGIIAFASTSFPRRMVSVDLCAPVPAPDLIVQQIQQYDQCRTQINEQILTSNAQRAALAQSGHVSLG